MKSLFTTILLSISFLSFAQFPNNTTSGSINTNSVNLGAITANKGFAFKSYADTSNANLDAYVKGVANIMITTKNNRIWQRSANLQRWVSIGGGAVCKGLNFGGQVAWTGTGLVFSVNAANYCINNVTYYSASTTVTLAASDPSLPRLDVIYVDTFGIANKITGTPAANPVIPQVNPLSQLYLTSILVPAGATTPGGVTQTVIYDENTEWTSAAFGSQTISFLNTEAPYHLTKSIKATGISGTSPGFSFTNATQIIPSDYSSLVFNIRLIGTMPGAMACYLSNTVTGANSESRLITSDLGFNPATIGSYQTVTVPLSELGLSYGMTTFNKVTFTYGGTNTPGFYFDYLRLQGGISQGSSNYLTDVYRKVGTDSVFQVKNGISYFAFKDSTGGGGGATPDSSWITTETGTPYTTVGTVFNNNLGSLPSGYTQINPATTVTFTGSKLQVSGTPNNWNNYLEGGYYNYDKERIRTLFVPTNKTSTSYGLGYTFSPNGSFYTSSLRVELNLTNIADSGRIKFNYDGGNTVAQSAPFSISIYDSVEFSLIREGWSTTAYVVNKTKGTRNELNYISSSAFGTGGKLRLVFLGGTQDITNLNVSSTNKYHPDYLIFGDSHSAGAGSSFESNGFAYLTFPNKTRFANISNGSLDMANARLSHLPNILTINPKTVLLTLGYNDRRDLATDSTTFRQRMDSLVSPLLRASINVILVNMVPQVAASQVFDTTIRNLAVSRGLQLIDVRSRLGGTRLAAGYTAGDGIHLSDSGHIVYSNTLLTNIYNLQSSNEADTTSFAKFYNLPEGKVNMEQLVVDASGNLFKTPQKPFNGIINQHNSNGGTGSRAQLNSEIYLSGAIKSDSGLFINTSRGLYINFNGGTANSLGSAGTNIDITNEGASGVGNPAVPTSFGTAAVSNTFIRSVTKGSYNTQTTGSYNVGIGNNACVRVTSGSRNFQTSLAAGPSSLSTGNDNIMIGGLGGQSTASNAILIGGVGGWGNFSDRIHLGYNDYGNAISGQICLSPILNGNTSLYIGGSAGMYSGYTFNLRCAPNLNPNQNGGVFNINPPAGNGTGGGGTVNIGAWAAAAAGATQTVAADGVSITRTSVTILQKLNLGVTTDYADNAAALAGGLVVGDVYRTGDILKIVHL